MFRGSNKSGPLLPHGNLGGGGGGGLYGTARTTPKASISKSFIATVVWALVSFSLIGGGWLYCSRRMESTSVICDSIRCTVDHLKERVTTRSIIPRANMVRADLVRLKNGQEIDPSRLRRSAQRKLGHTYSLIYVEPDSEDDDDESYDSFADDDDSFDSYDDEEDSSEDDEGPDGSKIEKPGVATGETKASSPEAKKKAFIKRKETQRNKWAAERESQGLPAIKEPDERARHEIFDDEERFPGDAGTMRERQKKLFEDERLFEDEERLPGDAGTMRERQKKLFEDERLFEDEERFPGDAGTMRERETNEEAAMRDMERNSAEIRRMAEAQGMAAEDHGERARKAYEKHSRAQKDLERRDAPMKRVGNNLHNGRANTDTDGGSRNKGGGRATSSVGGQEEISGNEDRRVSPEGREASRAMEEEGGQDKQAVPRGNDYETLGDFVQAGARGARRSLLSRADRYKEARAAPAKRTKAEVEKDASKARETHRQGHGARGKRARKVARPIDDDDSEAPKRVEKKKHHHRAFHHKEDVPQEERHHVHPAYHHRKGEKKIEHGWRHQNRQWHGHTHLKKLGTTFSLGRSKARKRKEAINNYLSKKTKEIDFTDSKKWRAGGLWMIIVGCISAAFCLVIGDFNPRYCVFVCPMNAFLIVCSLILCPCCRIV
ncbi:unnamed protein product [Pylaiella littoralis]